MLVTDRHANTHIPEKLHANTHIAENLSVCTAKACCLLIKSLLLTAYQLCLYIILEL